MQVTATCPTCGFAAGRGSRTLCLNFVRARFGECLDARSTLILTERDAVVPDQTARVNRQPARPVGGTATRTRTPGWRQPSASRCRKRARADAQVSWLPQSAQPGGGRTLGHGVAGSPRSMKERDVADGSASPCRGRLKPTVETAVHASCADRFVLLAHLARRTSSAVSATCSSVRCSPDSRSQSSIRSMLRRRW